MTVTAFITRTWTTPHVLSAASLVMCGATTVWLAYRLFDGIGLDELTGSLYALSGRLFAVRELPDTATSAVSVRSAVALRTIAERYRLPVLHHVDPASGHHTFLLITVQEGAFVWIPRPAPPTWDDGPTWGEALYRLRHGGIHRPRHRDRGFAFSGTTSALLVVALVAVASTAAASTLTVAGPDNVRAGSAEGTVCGLEEVRVQATSYVLNLEIENYSGFRISGAGSHDDCAGSTVYVKVRYSASDYFYMRIPATAVPIGSATTLGVFSAGTVYSDPLYTTPIIQDQRMDLTTFNETRVAITTELPEYF